MKLRHINFSFCNLSFFFKSLFGHPALFTPHTMLHPVLKNSLELGIQQRFVGIANILF
jgi:hypothetical protein